MIILHVNPFALAYRVLFSYSKDYLSILADPMTNALDSDKHIWTSVHNDSMVNITVPT